MVESVGSNFPIYETSLIGRSREKDDIVQLLYAGETPIVTLVGESGAGKTRLALEVATTVHDHFSDGVVFVPLAPVQDPRFVFPTIAATLGIQETPQEDVVETLATALHEQRILLILDNIEQVCAIAPALLQFVQQTPRVTLLITSQVALGITGESIYTVPPLALPSDDERHDLTTLLTNPAIALFVQRLQAVQANFQLTPFNDHAVVRICRLLDGFPLAIELVAAHSATLSPIDLLMLLRNHLGVMPHQKTSRFSSRTDLLNPVLDWCISRLPLIAQQIMQRLGVFLGGWTVDSVHAVLLPMASRESIETALTLLTQKHLITKDHGSNQECRYDTLDVIRAYSEKQLQRMRNEAVIRERHGLVYMNLAQESLVAKQGHQQTYWLRRLEREHHNMRAALQWSQAHRPEQFFLLVTSLAWFWRTKTYLSEAAVWLKQARQHPDVPLPMQGVIAYEEGIIAMVQNHLPFALQLLQRSLSIAKELENNQAIAEILNELGNVYGLMNDLDTSAIMFHRCASMWNALGNTWAEAIAMANLGYIYLLLKQPGMAMAQLEAAEVLGSASNDSVLQGSIKTNMGWVKYLEQDYEPALAFFYEAMTIHHGIGSLLYVPEQLEGLASVHHALDKPEYATQLLGAAAHIRQQIKTQIAEADQERYDRLVESIRARLAEDVFANAWEAGRDLSVEHILAVAVG